MGLHAKTGLEEMRDDRVGTTKLHRDMPDILLNEPLPLDKSSLLEKFKGALKQIDQGNSLSALYTLSALMASDIRLARDATLWLHIGRTYVRIGLWRLAQDAFESALKLDPELVEAEALKALAKFNLGEKIDSCTIIDSAARKRKSSEIWMVRAYIHAHCDKDHLNTLNAARDWGRMFADPLTEKSKLVVADRNPKKKLKIGYVTADFREHSVNFFMHPILLNHNHDDVCVYVYYNFPKKDSSTLEMQSLVSHWCDVFDLNDSEMLAKIRTDEIDILVDLSGFTNGNRLLVFAQRAAPVQLTWVGYLPTLGMNAMDYKLTDLRLTPPDQISYYSESLFYLNCVTCYHPPEYAPLEDVPPIIKNGYPTLISLNNSSKITDQMLKLWARILNLRSDARLIVMVKELDVEAAQMRMQPLIEEAKMPLDRVSVMSQQPLNNFMELGHIADIQLDTAPISGGTTTLHALWMGLSIVTMDAERAVDASTSAILRDIDSGGIICQDEESYINATLQLMDSPEYLQTQRRQLRNSMLSAPWMNHKARTKEIEKAMRLMWINFLRGDKEILSTDVDIDNVIQAYEALQ